MKKEYHRQREQKLAPRYRLKRRSYEVIEAIKQNCSQPKTILDIGTADGLMLSNIKKKFPLTKCIGIEYNKELIETCKDENIEIIQGDAQNMPFQNNFFDVAIATAIIEHLDQPQKLLEETYRILKPNGILILTTPNPFFEKIADLIGHFEENIHQTTFNIKNLKTAFKNAGFEILSAERFMMSPIGFPAEIKIEKLIKYFKLDFMLLNQLIIGKKIN